MKPKDLAGTPSASSDGGHGALSDVAITEMSRHTRRRHASGFIVGGFVRDLLESKPSCDIDVVVTGMDPRDLAGHLHRRLGFSKPVVFRRFMTVLVARSGLRVEICRMLHDLASDAARRDFTLNCLYIDLETAARRLDESEIIDPTGMGLDDLRARRLRSPQDPCLTLWLDPLRILRAARFYATDGFSPDRPFRDAMPRMTYLLGRVSVERIREELERVLLSDRVIGALRLLEQAGAIDAVVPEVARMFGFSQATPYHAYDLFTHSLKTVANTPALLTLRLAALLHDIGKVDTRSYRQGRAVYYGHDRVSARIAKSILERLRFSRHVTREVVFLVRNHMVNYSSRWSDKAVRRFAHRMGTRLEPVLALMEADIKAQRPAPAAGHRLAELRARIREATRAGRVVSRSPLDGNDIMDILRIEAGPTVGSAKEFLERAAVGRSRALTRAECVRLLRRWAKRQALA
jgi:putative nucleotidyltransferase with HDIG domain